MSHETILTDFNNVGLIRTHVLSIILHLLFFFVVPLFMYNTTHSRKGTPEVVLQRCYIGVHPREVIHPCLSQAVVVTLL